MIKTLTIPAGQIQGYDPKTKTLEPFNDTDRREIYTDLREASKTYGAVVNQAASMIFARDYLGVGAKDDNAEKFKPNYRPILDRIEKKSILSGGTNSECYMEASAFFSGDHKKRMYGTGERSLPSVRTDGSHPIPIRATGLDLIEVEGSYYMIAHIFSAAHVKEKGYPPRVAFPLRPKKRDLTMRGQLQKIIEEDWTLKNGRVKAVTKSGGRKWLCQLIVEYEPEPFKKLRSDVIMGVNLAVYAPACVHIRVDGRPQSWSRMVGNGWSMLQSRNAVKGEIVRILRALKSKDAILVGQARKSATEKLRKLRRRERNIVKTAAQTVAAQVADIAKRNGAAVWQIESLEKIKEDNPRNGDSKAWLRRNWAPAAFIDAIKWQAAQIGAEVKMIPPRHTTARCAACGHISAESVKPQRKKPAAFWCVACGNKDIADKNAARNLSIDKIDEIIKKTVENEK